MGVNYSRLDVLRAGHGPIAEHVIDEFVAGRLSRRQFLRRGTMIGLSLPLLGGIVAACGSSSSSQAGPGLAAEGKPGATIKAGIGVPAAAINPITIADQGGLDMLGQVAEWLAFCDQHNNYHPWLATSWSANADASVWTFKIRQGVKFNDGTPMTADDVVYSF
ncbi:MAG TPA: ABC transporter substrate-binding protein, partial [Streptosporangiaceae bacterium]